MKKLIPSLKALVLPFEYTADEQGIPLRFNDKQKVLNLAINFLRKTGNGNTQTIKKVENLFNNMDEETLALLFAKQAATLARWQKLDIALGQKTQFQERRSNPFGGSPISMITTIEAEKLDNQNVKISFNTKADPTEMANLTQHTLKKLAPERKDIPKLTEFKMNFQEYGHAIVNFKDGWTRSVTLQRDISTSYKSRTQKREDWTKVELERIR